MMNINTTNERKYDMIKNAGAIQNPFGKLLDELDEEGLKNMETREG